MTADRLRLTRDAHSFVPFPIRMADGRTHRVQHRDFLWITPTGRSAFVYRAADAYRILECCSSRSSS